MFDPCDMLRPGSVVMSDRCFGHGHAGNSHYHRREAKRSGGAGGKLFLTHHLTRLGVRSIPAPPNAMPHIDIVTGQSSAVVYLDESEVLSCNRVTIEAQLRALQKFTRPLLLATCTYTNTESRQAAAAIMRLASVALGISSLPVTGPEEAAAILQQIVKCETNSIMYGEDDIPGDGAVGGGRGKSCGGTKNQLDYSHSNSLHRHHHNNNKVKDSKKSELELALKKLPGVGPKKARALAKAFPSAHALANASCDALSRVLGRDLGLNLHASFRQTPTFGVDL
eukprot:UC1_evm1s2077